MVGGGEGGHVGADLGEHGLSGVVAEAGNILQPLGGVQKGGERSLEPRVEFPDGPLELLDRLQVLADQEPVMIARTSVERGGEFLPRAGRASNGRVRPAAGDRSLPRQAPSGCAGR